MKALQPWRLWRPLPRAACLARLAGSWTQSEPQYVRRRQQSEIPDTDVAAGLTREMRVFMTTVQEHQPDPWFHRKSDKLVLAVVQANIEGTPHFFEGMNAEVSLPTGSVCAERSALLHARSKFPSLSRRDFVGIAVLEVPLVPDPREPLANPLQPCGACREWLLKLQEERPSFVVVTYGHTDLLEIEERFPDGRCPEDTEEMLLAGNSIAQLIEPERPCRTVESKTRKLVAKLLLHWSPGEPFNKYQVRHRIPWFPAWWLDDLVQKGALHKTEKEKGKNWYCVPSVGATVVETTPCKLESTSFGEPASVSAPIVYNGLS